MIKLEKILTSDNVVKSINDNLDYILKLMPEVGDMFDFEHNHPHHHLDVWNHTLLALKNSDNDFEIRLTLLLHDIGKPSSYQDEEVRHFRGHQQKSKEIATNILQRLNCPLELSNRILYLIKTHDTLIDIEECNYENMDLILKRLSIQYADALAHHPEKVGPRIEKLNNVKEQIEDKILMVNKR